MNQVNLEEMKRIEELKKIIMKKILSKGALERLGRIKLVKPELAMRLELYLVQMYQQGKLKKEISDQELKLILSKLIERKKFKIIK